MISRIGKSGIAVIFFILLQCGNDPSLTLHPLLSLDVESVNEISQVVVSTSVAEKYSMYRIVDDACTLNVSYHKYITNNNGDVVDSLVVDNVFIANDVAAFQSGTFQGVWEIPDTLSFDLLIPSTAIQINGCVSDETNYSACASLMLYADTTLP